MSAIGGRGGAEGIRPRGNCLLGLTGLEIDGGIASVSRCVARALDERAEAGALGRVDRVLLYDEPRPEAPSTRFARGSYARFTLQLWAERWLRRPDLVFFDQLGPARSLAPVAGMPFGLGWPPTAIFCHGIELDRALSGDYRAPLVGADRLLVNSEHTGRFIEEHFPEAAERMQVVPLCIDPARIAQWEAMGWAGGDAHGGAATRPAREPAALIVGRMVAEEPGKGHEALIESWPAVRAERPDAELWIAGGGDDVERFAAKARAAGLGECVRFLGRISDEELADAYRRASVFAMPSRQEGFGLVYAEAMWHGLPCIASTADAGAEVVLDGETGRLVPYGDAAATARAVLEFLSDPDRVASAGAAAQRRAAERFTYPRFAEDLCRALGVPPAA